MVPGRAGEHALLLHTEPTWVPTDDSGARGSPRHRAPAAGSAVLNPPPPGGKAQLGDWWFLVPKGRETGQPKFGPARPTADTNSLHTATWQPGWACTLCCELGLGLKDDHHQHEWQQDAASQTGYCKSKAETRTRARLSFCARSGSEAFVGIWLSLIHI